MATQPQEINLLNLERSDNWIENLIEEVLEIRDNNEREVKLQTLKLCQDVPNRVDEHKASKRKTYHSTANSCHDIGHPCDRYAYYKRVHPEKAELPDISSQYAFDEGHEQEKLIRRLLEDAGFFLTGDGQSYTYPEFNIVGHIDGKIAGYRGESYLHAIPYDAKSMHPNIWSMIHDTSDFLKKPWLEQYIHQLNMYLMLTETYAGAFVCKNKSTGRIKVIPWFLNLEMAEAQLQKAQRINEAVGEKKIPDRMPYDEWHCEKCQFNAACNPDVEKAGALFWQDPETVANAIRMQQLEPLAKEYNSIKKELVETAKNSLSDEDKKDGRKILVGPLVLDASWSTQRKKATEARTVEFWTVRSKLEDMPF
jgi:CRISPR/Cas system-associated exonuclease Cas4 (RecB family)